MTDALLGLLALLLLVAWLKPRVLRWLVARETKYWRAFFARLGAPVLPRGLCDEALASPLSPRGKGLSPSVPNGGDSGQSRTVTFDAALDRIHQASLSTPAAKGWKQR